MPAPRDALRRLIGTPKFGTKIDTRKPTSFEYAKGDRNVAKAPYPNIFEDMKFNNKTWSSKTQPVEMRRAIDPKSKMKYYEDGTAEEVGQSGVPMPDAIHELTTRATRRRTRRA